MKAPLVALLGSVLACTFGACGGDVSSSSLQAEGGVDDTSPVSSAADATAPDTSGTGGATKEPVGTPSDTSSAVPVDEGTPCEKGGTLKILPGTQQEYCVRAHPDCKTEGADCPLYVTLNMGGAYFEYVDDPAKYGKIIVAALYHFCDCAELKDSQAELPRVIEKEYPGHDVSKVYGLGWSAGAGGIARGQCIGAKFQWDQSKYGKTSDRYAAVALIGGYPGCAPDFKPAAGNYHVFTVSGMNDIYGGSNNGDTGAEESLRRLAIANGCSKTQGTWCSVKSSDSYVPRADGTDNIQKITFGTCPRGDVVGYRFKDEAHTPSFKKHFDPKISGFELIFSWLQGRSKGSSGMTGTGGDCP